MSGSEVEAIVREAELRGHVTGIANPSTEEDRTEPWNEGPDEAGPGLSGILPNPFRLVLANMIYVHKSGLSSAQVNIIRRLAAFQNPEFYKAQAMRLSTYGKPRIFYNLILHCILSHAIRGHKGKFKQWAYNSAKTSTDL